jgi:excisionase family DNA binding protein
MDCLVRNENMAKRPVLTVKEVADYLHVHESTIYRLLKSSQLPAFRVGSDWRFNIETIDRWRLSADTHITNNM